jgi:hypothetical protein
MRLESVAVGIFIALATAPSSRADDFTIVVLGDTQTYSDTPALEPVFENMIDYVLAHVVSDDIALVLQVGDVIEQGTGDAVTANTTDEWARFNAQWKRLDNVVPYAVARGNHDNTQEFSLHYGSTPSSAFSHYLGTHPGEDDDAHAWRVDLGGQDALVLGISCNPSAAELGWAQGILDGAPDLPAIVLSHIITSFRGVHLRSASFGGQLACNGNPPASIWEDLVVPNAKQVFMTASGHVIGAPRGFKATRETNRALILDTLQNWQGGASANGCMTLVRFRTGAQEVGVEAFCTELDGGAGAFLDAPGETTLPTVTVDDDCLNFSLYDGVGIPPSPCLPNPLPAPIPGSSPPNPTISFNDDALVPSALPFGSVTVSSGSLLNLDNSSVLDDTEIAGSVLLEANQVFTGGPEDIDAAHFRADGQLIFSTVTSSVVNGEIYTSGDLILFDPATGAASKFFDESSFASTPQNIDAFFLFEDGVHAGKLLLSTASITNLGGLVFSPGDLVLYDPVQQTSTLFFSQSLITGTAAQRNIDAVHVLPNGNLLLSVLIDGGALGGLVLEAEDVSQYDPAAAVAADFLVGAGLFNGTTANLNAMTFAPAPPPNPVPALSPGALLVLALGLAVARPIVRNRSLWRHA